MVLLLAMPAMGAGEKEQWYDSQGKPVAVSAAVTEQRTEAEWVPGWLVRERERQARMGRKEWSHDRGWYGYGWANGRYWFRSGWPRYSSWRPYGWSGYCRFGTSRNSMRHGARSSYQIRVNTPGLQVNWSR